MVTSNAVYVTHYVALMNVHVSFLFHRRNKPNVLKDKQHSAVPSHSVKTEDCICSPEFHP
jgi:hypothetical protein